MSDADLETALCAVCRCQGRPIPPADCLSFLGLGMPNHNRHDTLLVDGRVEAAAVALRKIPHLPTDSKIKWHVAAAKACQKATFGVEVAQASRRGAARLSTAMLDSAGFARGPRAPDISFTFTLRGAL